MLLHNGNKFACAPIGHSAIVKEHYLKVKIILQKLPYSEHNCGICVDCKLVNFLLGQQVGVHQTSLFFCYWNSRATDQHWVKKDWRAREDLAAGD